MLNKRILLYLIATMMTLTLFGCGKEDKKDIKKSTESVTEKETTEIKKESETNEEDETEEVNIGLDYLVLVNKNNELPQDWEDNIETITMTNSLGDEVEVESKAYNAYLDLKAALEEDGVYVDLDSARRSVEEQQRIMDEFTDEYGADYAAKTVATPGYSEHHTGLALDLYLVIDGKDVYLNEDMVEYPDIWEKIHSKLADYGFILRYLEGKEHITGYGYEPWHIRYIDNKDKASKIMESGITLEEYLGVANSVEVNIDYGKSDKYTNEDLYDAIVQIKCAFAGFDGCELHSITYAGDDEITDEDLEWLNSFDENSNYKDACKFYTDFHSPKVGSVVFDDDTEITDYEWWLARNEEGGWDLIQYGF